MFIAALSRTKNTLVELVQLWSIHTTDYCSAAKDGVKAVCADMGRNLWKNVKKANFRTLSII